MKDSKFHFPSGGNFLTELGVTPIFKTYMNKPHHKGLQGEHGSMACIEVMRKEEVMTGQESHTQIDCQKARNGTENMKTREHTTICLNMDDFSGYNILGMQTHYEGTSSLSLQIIGKSYAEAMAFRRLLCLRNLNIALPKCRTSTRMLAISQLGTPGKGF